MSSTRDAVSMNVALRHSVATDLSTKVVGVGSMKGMALCRVADRHVN